MKDNKNFKYLFIAYITLMIIAFTFMIIYYNNTKNKSNNLNIKEEIQNNIKDENTSIISDKNTIEYDLIEKSEKKKEKSENKQTYDIVNDSEDFMTEDEFNNYKKQAYRYAKEYNWKPLEELEILLSQKYKYEEQVEERKWIGNLPLLTKFVYNDKLSFTEKYSLLLGLNDPVLYSYAFFSQDIDTQGELLKDQNSIVLYTKEVAPEFVSVEKVPPRTIGADQYFSNMENTEGYSVKFKVEDNIINFNLIENNFGMYPISILANEEDFNFLTFEDLKLEK